MKQEGSGLGRCSGCQKRPLAFSDSLQNAVTFVLLRSTKVLASLASILAEQGFRGIRSNLRRAAGPLKLPRVVSPFSIMGRFFDKLHTEGVPNALGAFCSMGEKTARCVFCSGLSDVDFGIN
jgi:hypothetical protein